MKNTEISAGAREMRNDYQRAWRRKNPHKLRQYHVAYWQKKYDGQKTLFGEPAAELKTRKTVNQLELLMPR